MRFLLGDYTAEGGPGLVVADADGLGDPAPVTNPSWVAVGPAPATAFALTETEPGLASAWRIGPGKALGEIGRARPTGGANPCHAAVDPSGRWLVVANYGDGEGNGSVAVLPIEADGALGDPADVAVLSGSGPDLERQTGSHAHQVVWHAGRALVVDLGSDRVHAFALSGQGRLDLVGSTAFEPGFGPRHLAFVGQRALVAGELANAVVVGDWDGDTATFALGPTVPLPGTDTADLAALPDIGLPEEVPRALPGAVVADVERGLVHVSVRGSDQLAVIDPALPALVRTVPVGGSWPRDAVLEPDGSILVACQYGGRVTRVDPTGEAEPENVWELPGAACVTPIT